MNLGFPSSQKSVSDITYWGGGTQKSIGNVSFRPSLFSPHFFIIILVMCLGCIYTESNHFFTRCISFRPSLFSPHFWSSSLAILFGLSVNTERPFYLKFFFFSVDRSRTIPLGQPSSDWMSLTRTKIRGASCETSVFPLQKFIFFMSIESCTLFATRDTASYRQFLTWICLLLCVV